MKVKNSILIDSIFSNIENKILLYLKDILLIFSFAILTGICAKLKIEIGPVPITMQTFAVLLSGALLGSVRGALSQLTYLVFGLIGLPWFARGGGMVYIMSPTFGYILGFVLAAFFIGWLSERNWDKNLKKAISAMLMGNLVLYFPGLLWLVKFVGFKKVLAVGFYPFILGDLLKIFLVGFLLPFFWKIIKGRQKI